MNFVFCFSCSHAWCAASCLSLISLSFVLVAGLQYTVEEASKAILLNMPQESRSRRRSIGYRTFLTCEDPRGVVECGTIRKPKIITPTLKEEHKKKPESERREHKSLILCSKEMQSGGAEEECQSPTSFHLLEVSRGAQKLNNVISSWSAGHSRSNSRDLAQDLLEGALDLGESLAMLSRFQHSPNHVSESTKKQHKPKMEIEDKGFVEDMQELIRNGVGRKHDFSSEEAFDAHSPAASNKKNKKTKRPNLIARLMGLEDASLRSLPYNHPRKHVSKGEKILKQKKPAVDQQFNSEQRWNDGVDKVDDRPPIVILRPKRFSCLDLEQPIVPKSRGDMFLGMRIRTNPLAQTDGCQPLKLKQGFGKEVKEARAEEKTCSLGKPKSHKQQFVEKNAEEAEKASDGTRKGTQSGSHFQSRDGYQIEITVADYADDYQSSPSETPLEYGRTDHAKLSHCSDVSASEGEEKQVYSVCDDLANGRTTTTRHTPCTDKLRALLLSSPPFIKHVEEHFDVKASPLCDHDEVSARELLDTANELVSLHGSRCSIARYVCSCSSLEQLLDEVCDEIKALRRFSTSENSLVLLVKGDLRTTGMVGGMWDVGWTSAGSADELQELTRGVEQLILDGLIHEMFV